MSAEVGEQTALGRETTAAEADFLKYHKGF